jgi:S-formylglutathione hydrolase FrmB
MPTRRSLPLLLLLLLTPVAWAEGPLEFQLTFTPEVSAEPFTGRVYVMLFASEPKGPPRGLNWFAPEPTLARDVREWKAGQPLVMVAGNCIGYPHPLEKLAAGKYFAVAIMDFDRGAASFTNSPGNGYSKYTRVDIDPKNSGVIPLKIDQAYYPPKFPETETVKLYEMESQLLTAFHSHPVKMRAGVVLPRSWKANPEKKYPVVYEIRGFGGTHLDAAGAAARGATNLDGLEVIHVVLDATCRLGHHVFADSDNNGPVGKALVEEFIPALEKAFRAEARPGARFVTGHSSGGWSSLWLQVTYPDFFGGVWSTAPDPVDFRDFQKVNIYEDANIFRDGRGDPRPLARSGERVLLRYQSFSDMEEIMAHGGQLGSFEAVFSPRWPDGKPRKLWDRQTGTLDHETAKAWEKYDIRLVLERNWATLGPKLKGKLHVYMGDVDTFYLDGAVRLLRDSQKKLGSDAVIEMFPGKNHGNLVDPALRTRIVKEMKAQYERLKEEPR